MTTYYALVNDGTVNWGSQILFSSFDDAKEKIEKNSTTFLGIKFGKNITYVEIKKIFNKVENCVFNGISISFTNRINSLLVKAIKMIFKLCKTLELSYVLISLDFKNIKESIFKKILKIISKFNYESLVGGMFYVKKPVNFDINFDNIKNNFKNTYLHNKSDDKYIKYLWTPKKELSILEQNLYKYTHQQKILLSTQLKKKLRDANVERMKKIGTLWNGFVYGGKLSLFYEHNFNMNSIKRVIDYCV